MHNPGFVVLFRLLNQFSKNYWLSFAVNPPVSRSEYQCSAVVFS